MRPFCFFANSASFFSSGCRVPATTSRSSVIDVALEIDATGMKPPVKRMAWFTPMTRGLPCASRLMTGPPEKPGYTAASNTSVLTPASSTTPDAMPSEMPHDSAHRPCPVWPMAQTCSPTWMSPVSSETGGTSLSGSFGLSTATSRNSSRCTSSASVDCPVRVVMRSLSGRCTTWAAVTMLPPSIMKPVPCGVGSLRSETSMTFFGAFASSPSVLRSFCTSSSCSVRVSLRIATTDGETWSKTSRAKTCWFGAFGVSAGLEEHASDVVARHAARRNVDAARFMGDRRIRPHFGGAPSRRAPGLETQTRRAERARPEHRTG